MRKVVRVPTGTPVRAPAPEDTKSGNTHSNTTIDGLSANVLSAGWQAGKSISGTGIPANTTIVSIAADGLSVVISNAATAAAPGVALTVRAANQWVPLGPMVTGRGLATGQPRISGRFRAIAVSPNGQRIYAGSALGGLWYSRDGGERWMALDFYSSTKDSAGNLIFADALTVGAVEVIWGPSDDEANDIVFVGAGEHPLTELKVPASPDSTVQGVGIRVATGPAAAVTGVGAAPGGPWMAPWRLEATDLSGILVNRIARDLVTNGVVWAATTRGLYRRPPAGGVTWPKVDTGLGDGEIADVVVVPGPWAGQERVYVTTPDGRLARFISGGTWQSITLPPFPPGTVRSDRVIQRVRLVAGHAVVYALAEGPRLWRIDEVNVERVNGLPEKIFDGDRDAQQPFGMCLAVHPSTQDLIAVGGHAFTPPSGIPQAAIFRGQLTLGASGWTFPPTPEWIGERMPVGVQALSWVPGAGPTQLWAAGDAGVFSSVADGAPGTFRERNSGLAAIESVALAQTPASDGVLLLGTRGNGVLQRVCGETWKVTLPGRCGGVAIDPSDPNLMYAQVSGASWRYFNAVYKGNDPKEAWPFLKVLSDLPKDLKAGSTEAKTWESALQTENGVAAETSRMAVIANRWPTIGTQLALGTDRIWYQDEATKAAAAAGRSKWVTLPTGTDPFAGNTPNRIQDVLDRRVLLPRWGSVDRLYVLTYSSVYLIERQQPSGVWSKEQLYDQVAVHLKRKLKTPPGQIPDDLRLTTLGVHDASKGKGRLYVGTSGNPDEEHLWWFDGTSKWFPTGLQLQLADSPVHAVAVDPVNSNVLYVGTDAGVWKGTGDFPDGGAPSWTWIPFSNALPEAPCVDLLITAPDDVTKRVLRAALAGSGVWEVALEEVHTQGPEVYLRAHGWDSRRETVVAGGPRDPFSAAGAQVRLDASPDIRVWRRPPKLPDPAAPSPQAVALPLSGTSDKYDVWLLQSALRVAGADLDPDGIWSAATAKALDDRRRVTLVPLSESDLWQAVVADNRLPYDRNPPDHADLTMHFRDEPDRWPKGTSASCASDQKARVQITVHSRHWDPIAATPTPRVTVALLKTAYGRRQSLSQTAPLPPGWAASLLADRAFPTGAWLVPPIPLAQTWFYADYTNPFKPVTGQLDPNNPQVVTFDVDLSLDGSWDKPGWLLLAVVLADDDPLTATETDVATLVRTDRRVAARSVRKGAMSVRRTALYAGLDALNYPGPAMMNSAWRDSNLMITGLYLDSPRPVPGVVEIVTVPPKPKNGHNRTGGFGAARGSWMQAWPEIHPDWGILPIYWGHQDPANADGPNDLRVIIALANAQDGASKAADAGIQSGAVIYLDWEMVPNAAAPFIIANGKTYCRTLWHALAELGYRPGVYCYPPSSLELRQECPGLFVWNVNRKRNRKPTDPPVPELAEYTVVNNQLWLGTPSISAVGRYAADKDAVARQWNLLNSPAGNPIVGWPQIDTNSCVVADPAFPERRNRPKLIRGGRVAVAPSALGGCVIYAVRNGGPNLTTWPVPPAATKPPVNPNYWWNPFSAPVALGIPQYAGTANPENAFLALGYAEEEGEDVWRLQALQRPVAGKWKHETVPSAGLAIDPLPGVIAITRSDLSIDAFVVDDDTAQIAGCRWDPGKGSWSSLARLLTGPGGAAATTATRRTNRPAAVSRDRGLADLFWVAAGPTINTGIDGLIYTTKSVAADPDVWSAPDQIGINTVRAHPFANLAAVSSGPNRIDVLFIGRADGTTDWLLYDVFWKDTDRWLPAPAHTIHAPAVVLAGPPDVHVEPLASIAACSKDVATVDAFAVGDDGSLYNTTLTVATGNWTAWQRIRDPLPPLGPVRLASVDGACSQGTNDIEVVVTGRDGNVYLTHWDSATAAYAPLEQVTPLNLP